RSSGQVAPRPRGREADQGATSKATMGLKSNDTKVAVPSPRPSQCRSNRSRREQSEVRFQDSGGVLRVPVVAGHRTPETGGSAFVFSTINSLLRSSLRPGPEGGSGPQHA